MGVLPGFALCGVGIVPRDAAGRSISLRTGDASELAHGHFPLNARHVAYEETTATVRCTPTMNAGKSPHMSPRAATSAHSNADMPFKKELTK